MSGAGQETETVDSADTRKPAAGRNSNERDRLVVNESRWRLDVHGRCTTLHKVITALAALAAERPKGRRQSEAGETVRCRERTEWYVSSTSCCPVA